MFRGNHQTRVDEKFRLKLPAEFKRMVDEQYGPVFYITSQDGKRAQLWPDEGLGGVSSQDCAVGSRRTPTGRTF